jgi:hypothetical protein
MINLESKTQKSPATVGLDDPHRPNPHRRTNRIGRQSSNIRRQDSFRFQERFEQLPAMTQLNATQVITFEERAVQGSGAS